MLTYLFMLMTSWAIVCDIYYLEPTTIQVSDVITDAPEHVEVNQLWNRIQNIESLLIICGGCCKSIDDALGCLCIV